MENVMHKGFKITQTGNFEFKVEKRGLTQTIGGLSKISDVKLVLDGIKSELDFFAKK